MGYGGSTIELEPFDRGDTCEMRIIAMSNKMRAGTRPNYGPYLGTEKYAWKKQ